MGAPYLPLPHAGAADAVARACAPRGRAGAAEPSAWPRRLDWERDGRDWPHREREPLRRRRRPALARAAAGPAHAGSAPTLLLLHGTGASTHSWRGLAPLLARAVPGGRARPAGSRLHAPPPAAAAVAARHGARRWRRCCARWACSRRWLIGHSAGAAIAARMAWTALLAPRGAGQPEWRAAAAARPGRPAVLAGGQAAGGQPAGAAAVRLARRRPGARCERLLDGTGSTLDADGLALYGRLVRNPGHVAGALAMMAQLGPAAAGARPAAAACRCTWWSATQRPHRAAAPGRGRWPRSAAGQARLHGLPGLGHLAHEEHPQAAQLLPPLLDEDRRTRWLAR